MRRFEFKDGKSNKFWEIEIEGNAFSVRYGKIGTEGQTQTKTFKDAAKAKAEGEKKIAEKTKGGYVEVEVEGGANKGDAPAAGKTARNPELEAAIIANFEDKQSWAVYADWLQGQGDPWGERISLALAQDKASGAEKAKLTKAIATYDQNHLEELVGKSLLKLIDADDFDQVAKLEWKYGFIVAARVAAPEFEWSGTQPDSILRALVKSPAGRFLRQLTIGIPENDGEVDFSKALNAISTAGVLPALDSLFIGDFEYPDETEISWTSVGDVGQVLLVAPNLRSLHVRGGGIGLGKELEHQKLESLLIETGGLPGPAVKAIGKAKLPELRRMEVWFGRDEYGGTGDIKMLKPLFSGEGVPKLEHLGLMNSDFENEIAIELAKSQLLTQVKRVDLSMGTLHDKGGKAILDNAKRFAHLESLDLDHNYLSDEMAEALEKALPGIVIIGDREAPDMWDDEPHYYTEIGE